MTEKQKTSKGKRKGRGSEKKENSGGKNGGKEKKPEREDPRERARKGFDGWKIWGAGRKDRVEKQGRLRRRLGGFGWAERFHEKKG